MQYHNEKYRVRRNKMQEREMKYLVDNKIFAGYADILSLSAIIGFNNNRFIEIDTSANDPVQLAFFTDKDRRLMLLIAYSYKKDQSILAKENDEKYKIFESYANGGFPILWEFLGCNTDEDIQDTADLFLKLSNGLKMGIVDVDITNEIFL